MKFSCPECQTRYSIAEDKLPAARTLRMTCKRCGTIIRFAGPSAEDSPPSPSTSKKRKIKNEFDVTRVASLEDLERLRMESEQQQSENKKDTRGPSADVTRVASIDEIEKALRKGGQHTTTREQTDPANDGEWYVLIGGKQKGPVSHDSVLRLLKEREIDARTYMWKDGMGDWKRMGTLEAFSDACAHAKDATWRVVKAVNPKNKENTEDTGVSTNVTIVTDGQILHDEIEDTSVKTNAHQTSASDTDAWEKPVRQPFEDSQPTGMNEVGDANEFASEQPTKNQDSFEAQKTTGDPDGYTYRSQQSQPSFGQDRARNARDSATNSGLTSLDVFASKKSGPAHSPPSHEPMPFGEDTHPPFVGNLRAQETSPDPPSTHIEHGNGYYEAPPGESTRYYIATAGLYKRRKNHLVAMVITLMACAVVVGILSLDILGLVELPGMGLFYETAGFVDPNRDRGLKRVQDKLSQGDLTKEERAQLESLRVKLLGLGKPGSGKRFLEKRNVAILKNQDIEPNKPRTRRSAPPKKDIISDVFSDTRKLETKVHLGKRSAVQLPNLPDGLTQEAITKVVTENTTSVNLCLAESSRKSERLSGKMEIAMTISPDGSVLDVHIPTPAFKNTAMAACAQRRIKNWRFPQFRGDPITVIYPYVLHMGF